MLADSAVLAASAAVSAESALVAAAFDSQPLRSADSASVAVAALVELVMTSGSSRQWCNIQASPP